MSNLQGRILTGIVLAAVMLAGIFGNAYSFFALFGVIAMGCYYEFLRMAGKSDFYKEDSAFGIFALTLLSGLSYACISAVLLGWIPTYYLVFLLLFAFLLILKELFIVSDSPLGRAGMQFCGLVYIVLALSTANAMVWIDGNFEPLIILGTIVLVWANDSFAYLVGRKIGKTPLFPRVSPNKTVEGSGGGGIGTLLFAVLVWKLFPVLSLMNWLGIALLVIVFGGLGDLVESTYKRSVGVKDSGTILPYHGGLLDRFDALIFCLPFVFSFLYLSRIWS